MGLNPFGRKEVRLTKVSRSQVSWYELQTVVFDGDTPVRAEHIFGGDVLSSSNPGKMLKKIEELVAAFDKPVIQDAQELSVGEKL